MKRRWCSCVNPKECIISCSIVWLFVHIECKFEIGLPSGDALLIILLFIDSSNCLGTKSLLTKCLFCWFCYSIAHMFLFNSPRYWISVNQYRKLKIKLNTKSYVLSFLLSLQLSIVLLLFRVDFLPKSIAMHNFSFNMVLCLLTTIDNLWFFSCWSCCSIMDYYASLLHHHWWPYLINVCV